MYNGLTNKYLNFTELSIEEVKRLGVKLDCYNLHLCANGVIISPEWIFDDLTAEGAYHYFDFSNRFSKILFEKIAFAENLKLKDIFILVKNNIDFLEPIINNYCREFCEVGLTDIKPYPNEYSVSNTEYLELYHYIDVFKDYDDETTLRVEGMHEWSFHGMGYELKETSPEGFSVGQRTPWGISYVNANELSDIPIQIKKNVTYYQADDSGKTIENNVFGGDYPKIIDILHTIFYELAWNGDPKKK